MRKGLRAIMVVSLLTWLCSCAMLSPGSSVHRIEEASYIRIGGIDQWVTIRGDDDRKPILLLVHGGPADAQSPFVASYAPYEHDFVLVQWDQRGAGRTFAKVGASASELTLERTITDGIELAEHLRKRFPDNKLILLGHSWGTVIGAGMATRRPDLFSAYVGTGQVASWAAGAYFQFDFLKEQARKTGNTQELATLEAIGRPDPLNIPQYFTFTKPLRQYMHSSDKQWLAGLKERAMANGETEADIKAAVDGMTYSGAALIQTIIRIDLPVTAPALHVPYCVIQGRHDISAPTDSAKAYFDKVAAPRKHYSIIEDAGHFALATHQIQFVPILKACLN